MSSLRCAVALTFLFTLAGLASSSQAVAPAAVAVDVELLPRPDSIFCPREHVGKQFEMTASSVIYFDERDHPVPSERSLQDHALALSEELYWLFGQRFEVLPKAALESGPKGEPKGEPGRALAKGDILLSFVKDGSPPFDGAYVLQVTPVAAAASGRDVHTVACATSTFLQLLKTKSRTSQLPQASCAIVTDKPSAEYRAVMIDVARHPHSISVLEDVIRLARIYRLRYVHLHLTDDQHFTFPFAPVTSKLENNASYSMEEMRGLVRYADARGITLIPEVDLPGHSSRLRESGYLGDAKTDGDVASEASAEGVATLLNAVMDVFESSPYFHIGGDESGAGAELVPFLARMNKVVRARGKQLIVWEGFHGAPVEQLPPTGENAVLVASWESSYNPPWKLLEAGYELINASWRPLYVVGGDSRLHPGSSGGRKWPVAEIASWNKDRFMHWEPGRPVFEDQGPGDENLDDGIWDVPTEAWRSQILGGQLCVWEQRESSVIRDLRWRLPVLADRLWSGADASVARLEERIRAVDARVFPLVQPLEFFVEGDVKKSSALGAYTDGEYTLGFRAPAWMPSVKASEDGALTPQAGGVRWVSGTLGNEATWIDMPRIPVPTASDPLLEEGQAFDSGIAVAARRFSADGTPIGGATWGHVLPFAACVSVTEFDIGRRPSSTVPDFDALPKSKRIDRFMMPFLRGPLTHTRVVGQRSEATLQLPDDGTYELSMKTQSGVASLWVDLNRDGEFSEEECLVANSPTSEEVKVATQQFDLAANEPISIRIDHATALPRPVLVVYIEGGELGGRKEISPYLLPLK